MKNLQFLKFEIWFQNKTEPQVSFGSILAKIIIIQVPILEIKPPFQF
jgi:hypothetical protein